ncbi:hypothetical protein L2725_14860 [Shewanella corallii]|uniref:Flagellar hook-length control protein-like C-terminal domain-containing protein n=1 Tax=Shewanella corallii TaxID=560080 RepID=A0ABT0N983_9GAMM|nr:hypothetical protein [Shewanella corallii]MCL2915039.1 hypothetical protein [Shewanella corallii]
MINGVSDALKLAGQLAPVSQTVKSTATGNSPAQQQPQLLVGQFRHAAFERWAKMTEAQHRISSAQLAVQAQSQIHQMLKQMLQLLPQARSQQPQAQAQLEQLRGELSRQQPSYLGLPLLDHQFNLRLNQQRALRRRFRLKSVNLASSKARDEQITLQLPTAEGPLILSITLAAGDDGHSLSEQLTRALSVAGLQVSFDGSESIFECDDSQWPLLKEGLLLKGQGHRLPAGDTRLIKVQEQLHWQDPREWDLKTAQGLQQTEIKLTKTCRKLEAQIRQTRAQLAHLGNVLHTRPDTPEPELLETISNQFAKSPFSEQLKALLAQANLGRNQAKDLLKEI